LVKIRVCLCDFVLQIVLRGCLTEPVFFGAWLRLRTFFILGDYMKVKKSKLVQELEERCKITEEFFKNYSCEKKVYQDGLIGEYQKIADQNSKKKRVGRKYNKIKLKRM